MMFRNKKLENIDDNVWDIRFRVGQIEASLTYIMAGMEELTGKKLEEILDVDNYDEKQDEFGFGPTSIADLKSAKVPLRLFLNAKAKIRDSGKTK